ncbi:prosaposin-like isoform X1 [Senna tora]|uniref:Pulmonary surfactant-associated protein B n=1 Tax=Senna tora TaxID=362788 RepID=A0A834XK29_9FABA|nr:prosaposin-like isoform X1 [Senna tora]
MEVRTGLLFLFVLVAAWACDARELAKSDPWSEPNKKDVCALCEEYSSKALDYLTNNKTQDEIIDILHNTCHEMRSFKQQCLALVDQYVPLFFLEVASIQPGEFCKEINLCKKIVMVSSQIQEDSCGLCKDAVSALLVKLENPDTELEIIGTLLKVCNSLDKQAQKCKRMVFQYGPVILANAEKFLETTDICTALHACKASSIDVQAQVMKQMPLLSDS